MYAFQIWWEVCLNHHDGSLKVESPTIFYFYFITVMYPLNSQRTVCVWGNIYRYILILCIIWWLCIHSILDWRIIKLLIIELIICALMCPVLLYVFVNVTVCIVFYVYSILWCLFYCIYLSFSKYTLKICSLVFGLFCLT